MNIDTTSYLNSTKTSGTSSTASSSLGKDDFLQILVAQLKTQDPFNSTDPTQMVNQMTQFSMLEQMTNMNTTLTSGLSALNLQTATSASAYIGKTVKATGSTLTVSDGTASSATYTLTSDAASLKAYIYDSDGSIIRTVNVGTASSGDHTFQWDGKDSSGNSVSDGTYTLAFGATDSSGNELSVSTAISGVVSGVSVSSGAVTLSLKDGREVLLSNVQGVSDTDA